MRCRIEGLALRRGSLTTSRSDDDRVRRTVIRASAAVVSTKATRRRRQNSKSNWTPACAGVTGRDLGTHSPITGFADHPSSLSP